MSERTRPAVFLDRDGVLNELLPHHDGWRPPFSVKELRLCDDAATSTARLRGAGFLLVVVTNQPDVGRGAVTREAVDAVNERVVAVVGADAVYVCPHGGVDPCTCRKPLPGLLACAAEEHGIDLGASWIVGDRWIDVAAGRSAGVRGVLVERPWSWAATSAGAPPADLDAEARFPTLAACVDYILER